MVSDLVEVDAQHRIRLTRRLLKHVSKAVRMHNRTYFVMQRMSCFMLVLQPQAQAIELGADPRVNGFARRVGQNQRCTGMPPSYCKVSSYPSWVAHNGGGSQSIQNDQGTKQLVATYTLLLSYDLLVVPHKIGQGLLSKLIVKRRHTRLLCNVFLTGTQVASI